MAKKKKTIEQLAERKRFLLLRARRDLAEAIYCDEQIEKMRTGKIKAPAPKGVKVKLSSDAKITADEFGDLVPTFGNSAAFE
jgi:hypothetical protein